MALVAQSVAVAQADLDRAKVIAAEALANFREVSARRDAIYAEYGATSPEGREIRIQANAANRANSEAQAAALDAQEIFTSTKKRGGFNETADPAAQNPADPLNSVSVDQIQATATPVQVTVTPVDPVPLDQIRTNAVGLPAATLVEEAGLDIQNNNPVGPDPLFAPQELDATGSLAETAIGPDPLFAPQELDATGSLAETAIGPDPYAASQELDATGSLAEQGNAEARRIAAGVADARRQQTLLDQQRQLNNQDWRVRLSLAPNSNYLYNVANPGILDPLRPSNGVIFPYTPQITTSYKANYSSYDLTHSNYRGYFYQNSYTDNITITATFTAQNTQEANYLLAVIHFFRSVTKMFYGQSQNLGSPPPMCFLNGLGDFQFNKHPVLVTQFNYSLPADVDYIRAGSANNLQLNQNQLRNKQVETTNNSLRSVFRLANALLSNGRSLPKGATSPIPAPSGPPTKNPTYVPTKMDIVITLLPVQSRQQVSQVFNLQEFANGNQLKGGFW